MRSIVRPPSEAREVRPVHPLDVTGLTDTISDGIVSMPYPSAYGGPAETEGLSEELFGDRPAALTLALVEHLDLLGIQLSSRPSGEDR